MSDSITKSLANRDDTRAKVSIDNMFDLGDGSYESQHVIISFNCFIHQSRINFKSNTRDSQLTLASCRLARHPNSSAWKASRRKFSRLAPGAHHTPLIISEDKTPPHLSFLELSNAPSAFSSSSPDLVCCSTLCRKSEDTNMNLI
jgi:hypothetical protein